MANPTSDLQTAADRAGPDSLRRPLVLALSLSLRDVEELLDERGLQADHTTVWRWVQRYAPELEQQRLGSTGQRKAHPPKGTSALQHFRH